MIWHISCVLYMSSSCSNMQVLRFEGAMFPIFIYFDEGKTAGMSDSSVPPIYIYIFFFIYIYFYIYIFLYIYSLSL